MTRKQLRALTPILRELGIKRFRTKDFELEFWISTDATKAESVISEPEKIMSEDEILYWSAGDTDRPQGDIVQP
jgi:5'-3' exonuclease